MQALIHSVHKSKFFDFFEKDHKNMIDSNEMDKRKCRCFNCILKWPVKNGMYYPLFDYENQILKAIEIPQYCNTRKMTKEDDVWYEEQKSLLENTRGINKGGNTTTSYDRLHREKQSRLINEERVGHVLVLKSAGLGLTTFFLRYIAWICLRDDRLKGQDIVIISGPREQLSIDLITRLRQLFLPFDITFDTKETTLFLNGVRIRSFPSNNLSAVRGIESCAMIFLDEAAFFDKASQKEVLDVVERYGGKNPGLKIALVSTPNRPGDLMHSILAQADKKSFYKILKFPYDWGVGKIYSDQDIRIAKASDSFEREYNCSFASPSGNVFNSTSINRAIELASKYPDTINKAAQHSCGIDPGFGSSACGFCVLEGSDSIIKVVYAKQFERSSFDSMVQKIWEIKTMVGELSNVYIDQANVEYIEAVKQELGDNSNWDYIHETLAKYKKMRTVRVEDVMKVIPVSFGQSGAEMLSHCKNILENEDSLIAINPKYEDLITSLRGATATEYKLNKTETPFADLMDAFRLALKFWRLEK
jgi:hypothetical protein